MNVKQFTRILVAATAVFLTAAPQVQADEPQIVTVALLLSPFDAAAPRCVVFDGGPPLTDHDLIIDSTEEFGDFAGASLTPTDAIYITQGGRQIGVVYGFADALTPNHGAMLLGAHSDVVVEFSGFVARVGGTLQTSGQQSATHLLVIVTGIVHGG